MGTPQFAVPTLELLAESRFKPILVVTQPDKPQGRKQNIMPTAIKTSAHNLGIKCIQPDDINDEEAVDIIRQADPAVIVTAAFGSYLKKPLRSLPLFGCLNLHPSLLPKYRGSSPINQALLNGDLFTGNTIFKIVARMDAGPVYLQNVIPIEKTDNYTLLHDKLALSGAKLMLEALEKLETSDIKPMEQDHSKASFCSKIEKEDLWLNWQNKAEKILNHVRSLSESPAAITIFRSKRLKIIETEITENKSMPIPGSVVEVIKNSGILVSTQDQDILIKRVQPEGKKIMTAYDFHLGAQIKKGERFEERL
jgi:methionyl-tRNA formyltransferase